MAKSPKSLTGKVAVITGGARGIGRATAGAMAAKGMRVAIGDLDPELAQKAADEIGNGSIGLELDVTDLDAFTAFVDEVERQLGPIDVLVNNAGIMPTGPIVEESRATTTAMVAINLEAVIHGTKEAARRMVPRGTGHIVNISSAAGKIAGARAATYSATKFGVIGFSEAVALELHGTGVELTCIMPAITKTDLAVGLKELRGVPTIEPADVANAIVESLEHPIVIRPVPKVMGAILNFNQSLPWKVKEGMARLTKAESVIAESDHEKRKAYDERVARPVAATSEEAEAVAATAEDSD